ncbi:S8 family serine peptidase [Ruminococcus sp.]|uniref:S8 family serine peptidase n=1 Tax=Ruminococcus sp. TaxID=41978 RepID=UPI0025D581A0|nr:S8 family serine peptidase [Ruminococcus sp.]
MRKTRILTVLTSAALSINLFSGSFGITCLANSTDNAIDIIEDIDYSYVGTEHAYDPMAEIEAEEAEKKYRENAEYEANKVVFSVIDHRSADKKGCYLSDNSIICLKYELKNVRMVYESVNKAYDNGDTTTAYEVFYEAETSSDDIWSIVDQLNEDEDIASAEPVYVWKKSAIGEPVEVSSEEFARETHFSILETEKVWKSIKNSSTPGAGTVVAVIDTGVDYNHKDLAENIWINPGEIAGNGIDDDGNGYVDDIHGIDLIDNDCDPMDDHGHGTHVAGAIAMTAGNGGGVGLAYGAQIMCIKAGRSDGTFASSDIARAVKYAADNGADVINMSFGGEEKSSLVEAALKDAYEVSVLVASAGNDGLPTTEAATNGYNNCMDVYPAGYNFVVGVMASDNDDHLAPFSNWDYILGKGCEYEMTAPGVYIYSTLPDNRYAVWSGTSLAAANVAAAAAIIRSEYPQKSKYDSKYIMGQLINASSSKATAESVEITVPMVTTSTTSSNTTIVTTTTFISDDPFGNADVDGKEGIDNNDFTYLLKGIVGINELGGSKGDVNCDGTADMFDAVSILRLFNNPDSVKDIMESATINKETITFDIPLVDINKDGNYTKYTFSYESNLPFKAITGQLKFNGKNYSGEFKDVKLIESADGGIIYEFNPENGKFAAYSANNGTSGSFTISTYEGKDGSYSVDPSSLSFYDENGKKYRNFDLANFHPSMTINSNGTSNAVTAAVNSSAVAVYDKKVEYPRLNIMDSLTVQPHPDLRVLEISAIDSADISDINNGDGIIQPGETVDIGISIWNKWGAASDVTINVETVGADGKANPYVEIVNGKVELGKIDVSSGLDNGLNYNGDSIKSVSKPIRIKIKDNAPNDGKMEFVIIISSKNGFDSKDTNTYTLKTNYSFIVQNMVYLSGKIKKDITLDKSRFWIIKDTVSLENGAIMTIKPGTQVKFAGYLYADNGELICNGTQESPISLFKENVNGGGYGISAYSANLRYTNLFNLELILSSCDHCNIIYNELMSDSFMLINDASNSIIYDANRSHNGKNTHFLNEITISNAYNCLFNAEVLRFFRDAEKTFNYSNNVFVRNIKYNQYIDFSYEGLSRATIKNNAFLNNYNDPYKRGIWFDAEAMQSSAINNYYGTEDPKLMRIPDDAIEEYPDIYNSYLTLDSSEIENIYPFMTEAYITNEKGDCLENAYPGQKLFVHVKFNRDMAKDVMPQVTLGVLDYELVDDNWIFDNNLYDYSSNYDEYSVTGKWISAREWIGYFELDDSANEGMLYIRSEGAVSADDRWLVTGNDGGRFGFNVINPATIQTGDNDSSKLKGKGGAGCNQLTWPQDEMATLAGYNLYRSVGDSNNFIKLNKSLLSNEDLQYTDTDVITGQKYYYYFTTVDTDFKESKPSNTVECIPLDSEKPQIKHTPVTYSEPNKAIVVSADVTDNVKVDNVTLFYKYSNENEWNSIKMRNTSGSNYQKVFSAYEVKNGKIQYYIEANDGINKAYYGTEKQPNIIEILPVSLTTTKANVTTTIQTTSISSTTGKALQSTTKTSATTVSTKSTTVYGPTQSNTTSANTRTTQTTGIPNGTTTSKSSTTGKTLQSTTKTSATTVSTKSTTVYGSSQSTTTSANTRTTQTTGIPSETTTSISSTSNNDQIPTINDVSVKVDMHNKEVKFFAEVNNNVKADKVTLYYRYIDDAKWTALEMQHTTNSTYFAQISPSDIKMGTLGYYIEANDGLNTSLYGSRLKPYVIEIPSLDSTNLTTTTTTLNSTTETYTTSKSSTTSSTSTTIYSNHATTKTTTKTQNTTTSTTTTKPTTTTTTTSVTTTEKSTTTATTTTTTTSVTTTEKSTTTATTTTTTQTNPTKYNLGDVDNNSVIDAVDASKVLAYYARISTKQEGGFIDSQKKAADVNDDGIIDAVDASKILTYYAYASTTDEVFISIDVFLTNRSVKSEDPSG